MYCPGSTAPPAGQLALISGIASKGLWFILERFAREGVIEPPPPAVDSPARLEDPTAPSGTHRQLFETKLHPLPEDT